ncbi:Hypothetical predicted protein [Olea europaea subsp. europaea]|uniref:Uncharacterized protein n=1 Tax=Olea europaea subsp. europaea TaxID=158383 RepID=A0A8S0SEY8_OLEEU|nr:Hypothetical predicted protein [Olea europaea subsp. europaea]
MVPDANKLPYQSVAMHLYLATQILPANRPLGVLRVPLGRGRFQPRLGEACAPGGRAPGGVLHEAPRGATRRMRRAAGQIPSVRPKTTNLSVSTQAKATSEQRGLKRNGTEQNKMERNGTERNGAEQRGTARNGAPITSFITGFTVPHSRAHADTEIKGVNP